MVPMDTVADLSAARDAYRRQDWPAARDGFERLRAETELEARDLYALGDCHWWVGDLERALPALQEAYRRAIAERSEDHASRIALDVAYTLAQLDEQAQSSGWMRRAERAAASLGEHPVHGYFEYVAFEAAFEENRLDDAAHAADLVERRARRHEEPTLTALAVLARGRIAVRRGDLQRGLAMLDEAMLAAVGDDLAPDWAGNIYCHLMAACEEIADLRRAMEWTDATARWCSGLAGGSGPFMGICRMHRANLLQLRGDWPAARREARRVLSNTYRLPTSISAEAHYVLGEIAREQGDLDDAERRYRHAHELGRDPQPGLAHLALARGRAASADAQVLAALAAASGDVLARARILPAAVETAIAVGDLDRARAAAAELAAHAARYRTAGFEATAAHAQGRILLAEGDPAAALPLLRHALRSWQELEATLPSVRVRADLERAYAGLGDADAAARERRASRAARAALLAEPRRARGGDVDPGLTPREAEVLGLVARGRTNLEIAHDLVLSVRTVERHLVGVYDKLGVSGRSARAAAVGIALRAGLVDPPD